MNSLKNSARITYLHGVPGRKDSGKRHVEFNRAKELGMEAREEGKSSG